jgi:HK97 family phage major capsid protein
MTTAVQDTLDRRANIWSQMQEIMSRANADGTLSAEDEAAYAAAEIDLDNAEAAYARQQAHAQREAQYNQVDRAGVVGGTGQGGGTPEQSPHEAAYLDAFQAYIRNQPMTPAQAQALGQGRTEPVQGAAGVGTGSAGGYLVPPAFRQKLVEQMTFVAAMRQYAEVITTDTGANLPWPTVNDTSNEGAILGENTQISEQDVTFGQASLDAYMYTSLLVRVSLQLLNDNAFDINTWLPRALGARIGRVQNRHFTVGTGTGQPDGIVTSATVGVTTTGSFATTKGVGYDDLIDLIDSIDPSYQNANSRFMMSQATRKVLRKLKDSQNRPLWEPSIQVGVPDVLLGYPLSLNNYMAAPAVNAKAVVFGDIREAYVIRDVSDLAVMRLVERYADFLQVGFFAFQRSDGTLQNASAAKTLQMTATA